MIELRNIVKTFGKFHALESVGLEIQDGEFLALLGPSGCGKTTLLRIIAGLESPDSGDVLFDERDVTGDSFRWQEIGFVFQHYALFRHMTVFDNVAFGLQVKPRNLRPSFQEILNRVTELLQLVQLDWAAHKYPQQLSGGQRQRIALARALAVEPKMLLLDEPFGSLDAKVRKQLRRWLRRLHDTMGLTSVFVTHDQEEAMEVADRIVVMNHGKIEQVGTPEEIYNSPANAFVFQFLGNANMFDGFISNGKLKLDGIELPFTDESNAIDGSCLWCVRPHDVYIKTKTESDTIPATVNTIHFLGPTTRIELKLPNERFIDAEINSTTYRFLGLRKGQNVYVTPRNPKIFATQQAS